jgi:hypothetical protein
MALLGQRLRLHVGEYANTPGLLSNTPTWPGTGHDLCLQKVHPVKFGDVTAI